MDNFEKEFERLKSNYAQGLEYKTYIEELFDGQGNYFGELRVDGTFDCYEGLEDVKIMLVNNGMNNEPIAVDITAMISDDKFKELLDIANERLAEHLSNIFKDMYENME
jgi:hypothetical protein